ncbi:hypothetical protein KNE206_51070 [Kitasatospora sp. NE20-6]
MVGGARLATRTGGVPADQGQGRPDALPARGDQLLELRHEEGEPGFGTQGGIQGPVVEEAVEYGVDGADEEAEVKGGGARR